MKRLVALVLFALAALPAAAQSTRARLDDLELRMGQVEETVRGQALVELSQRVDTLAADLRLLRGDLEVMQEDRGRLQRELEALRQRHADLIARLEQRLAALEARLSAAGDSASAAGAAASALGDAVLGTGNEPRASSPPAGAQAATPASAETPEVLYGRAFDALKASRYPEAIVGMSTFIERHPVHPLSDNAHYWLGQTYFVTRDYAKAVDAFAAVGADSPDSAKAPDALLKKGLCEVELGRTDAARASFEQVLKRYPQNDAVRLAREQLQRLR
jgi:tol-pal system protein YbgF